jgi:hypothetical protein
LALINSALHQVNNHLLEGVAGFFFPNRNKPVAASVQEKNHKKKSGSLVAIYEAMVGGNRLNKGSRFLFDFPVIAGVRTGNRCMNGSLVSDASEAAKTQRPFMGGQGISQSKSVVTFSDRRDGLEPIHKFERFA